MHNANWNINRFFEFAMFKSASPSQKLIGFATGAVVFGSIAVYTDEHFPPWSTDADIGHRTYIRHPENYQDPREIVHEPVQVPNRSVEPAEH